MMFTWQSDLCKFPQDSWASRFVITTIPSSAYVFDGDVNITLQCASQHIVTSLSNLKITIPNIRGETESWTLWDFLIFSFTPGPMTQKSGLYELSVCHISWLGSGAGFGCLCDGFQRRLEIYPAAIQPSATCILREGVKGLKLPHQSIHRFYMDLFLKFNLF